MSSYSGSYTSGHRTASSASWPSSSTASYTASYNPGTYSSAPSVGSPPTAELRNGTHGGHGTATKSRLNHKKQIVCVTNFNQQNNDAGEPRPEYRDASRYYGRGA